MTRIISQSRNAPTYACDVLLRYGLATARKTLKKVKSKKKKKKAHAYKLNWPLPPVLLQEQPAKVGFKNATLTPRPNQGLPPWF